MSEESDRAMPPASASLPPLNRLWPFAGGDIGDIGVDGRYVEEAQAKAGPDEVVARIDAVCICSSDIKIIRMGAAHPLFADRDLKRAPAVLGHEMALTVCDVGEHWRGRFQPGDRLGVQPAITVEGVRRTVGMDLPGAFAQYIRLDARVLAGSGPYVFPVPPGISAATVAMLEPYSCVEAAYRPNCRTTLSAGGSLLVVGAEGADAIALDMACPDAAAVTIVGGDILRAWAGSRPIVAFDTLDAFFDAPAGGPSYDDILVLGRPDVFAIERLAPRLAKGGLMALVGTSTGDAPVTVDAARIHYHELSFLGAPGPSLAEAFAPSRHRFAPLSGGTMLILGAGGAMGRIHVHRAIELPDGPATIIAASRKPGRCDSLEADFGALARRHGKRLIVIRDDAVEETVARLTPGGCDDVVVVAPEVAAIERGAGMMKPDGMIVLFAGMPFGKACRLPLGLVASHGARFTGSTGSKVADQLAVLDGVVAGSLDLSGNLEAVAGFAALPDALKAVSEGRVSGKIAIYPSRLDLPVTPISSLRPAATDGERWNLDDERDLVGA